MSGHPPSRTPAGGLPDTGPRPYQPHLVLDAARAEAEATLLSRPGVRGVGDGQDATGAPAWIVYVVDRGVASQLPPTIGGRPVVVEVSGEIDALPR